MSQERSIRADNIAFDVQHHHGSVPPLIGNFLCGRLQVLSSEGTGDRFQIIFRSWDYVGNIACLESYRNTRLQ
jgi:hypothetical protein